MVRPTLEEDFYEPAYVPAPADVTAAQATYGVGKDTALILARRDTLEAQAAALRSGGADVALCDLLDAIIAAVFDA